MLQQSLYSYLLTFLLFHIPLSYAQTSCATYCSNYDQILVNCRNLYSSGVDGSGDISVGAVSCMCIGTESFTGYYEMSKCRQCNILTGNDAIVNFAWVQTCYTNQFLGPQAAVRCWNTDIIQLGTIGSDCYQSTSAAAASVLPATSSSTSGGNGGGVTTTTLPIATLTRSTAATAAATGGHSTGTSAPSVISPPASLGSNTPSVASATSELVLTGTATASSTIAAASATKSSDARRAVNLSGVWGAAGVASIGLVFVI